MDSSIVLSDRIDDLDKRIDRYEATLKSLEDLVEKIIISVDRLATLYSYLGNNK